MKTFEQVMSAPLTNDELEAMKYGYYASRVFESGNGRTVVAWTYGIPCALPKANIVMFVIPGKHWAEAGIPCQEQPAANTFFLVPVKWDDVVNLIGERWEYRFDRYCVHAEDFPNATELDALMGHKVADI
jgi:hypothetical protein